METDFMERIKACKGVLEEIVDSRKYYVAAIVRNGRIITNSILGNPKMNLNKEVRKAERYLITNGTDQDICYKLIVTLPQRKI